MHGIRMGIPFFTVVVVVRAHKNIMVKLDERDRKTGNPGRVPRARVFDRSALRTNCMKIFKMRLLYSDTRSDRTFYW